MRSGAHFLRKCREPFKIKALSQMEITTKNYQNLLLRIQKTIKKTEENLIKSVNRQKVVLSWEIGKEIDKHLLELEESSDGKYGKNLFEQLSASTQIDKRTLYQMHAFYKTYPSLPAEKSNLTWSHYRNLVSVQSDTKRQLLEDLTVKNDLDSRELQRKISKTNSTKKKKTAAEKPIFVKRGKLFTYAKTESGEVDLGFNIFLKVANSDATEAEYTYVAKIEKIVDGDTIHVKIDLGFDVTHQQILRLAKINAAEATTKEGKKATARLKEILKDIPFMVIKTNKTDIYGRYVADVFLPNKNFTPQQTASDGIYLNQLLLDEGLVTRY